MHYYRYPLSRSFQHHLTLAPAGKWSANFSAPDTDLKNAHIDNEAHWQGRCQVCTPGKEKLSTGELLSFTVRLRGRLSSATFLLLSSLAWPNETMRGMSGVVVIRMNRSSMWVSYQHFESRDSELEASVDSFYWNQHHGTDPILETLYFQIIYSWHDVAMTI